MRRTVLMVAALALPISGALAAMGGPAAAAAKAEKSITCKVFAGTVSGTITLSKCNGNTGGSSQALSSGALASGGTLVWTNSKQTVIGTPVLSGITSKKCKATGDSALSVSIPVTSDTTGLTSLGTLTTQVCIDGSGNITGLKPVKIT